MSELFLHVGMDKTGTSAIQRFMVDNKALLAREHGVCYPKTGLWTDGSHHPLAFGVFGQHGYSPSSLLPLLRDLCKEAANIDKVLISSECLFKAPSNPNFDILRKELLAHFENVIIIVYVRRQDLWVDSRYRHAIISGQEIPLQKLLTPHFCDYKKWIDAWAEVVGKSNIRVRVYESEQFIGGNIFSDFLSVLGLPMSEKYAIPKALLNTSLGNPETEFKRLCNHLATNSLLGNKLNDALLNHSSTGKSWKENFLSLDARGKILEACSERNAGIAREYLGRSDGILFSADKCEKAYRFVTDKDLNTVTRFIQSESRILHAMLLRAIRKGQKGANTKAKSAALSLSSLFGIAASGKNRKSKRQLIIHFGVFKTGSSSIQETLFHNRHCLDGFEYIHFGAPNSSCVIRNAFLAPERLPEKAMLNDSVSGFGFDMTNYTKLSEISSLALRRLADAMECEGKKHLILSAEVITHFAQDECRKMLDTLTRYSDIDGFVGYVREPVSYMRSVFQQVLKKQFISFNEYGKKPVNYDIVAHLDKLVGRDRVRVYPFEQSLFPDGDVVRHFLEHVGINVENIHVQRVNEGLSLLAVKLLYVYRKLRAPRDQDVGDQKSWVSFIARLQTLGNEPFVLHPSVEGRIAAANDSIYKWSQDRLDTPFESPTSQNEQGVRNETDLMNFSDEELALIMQYATDVLHRSVPSPRSPDDIADLMHQVRTSYGMV